MIFKRRLAALLALLTPAAVAAGEPGPGPARGAALTLRSATVMTDGRIVRLVFAAAPVPAAYGVPDWENARPAEGLPVLSNGTALEPIGAWADVSEYPAPDFGGPYSAVRGGALPAGSYFVAYVVKDRAGAVVGRSAVGSITIKAGDTPTLYFVGGYALRPGHRIDIYVSAVDAPVSTLALYKTNLSPPQTGPKHGIPLEANSWVAKDRPHPGFAALTWSALYLVSDPARVITFGAPALKVRGAAGLWHDGFGQATAAFPETPVENRSLAGPDGFTSRSIERGRGGVTLYVSSSHGSETGVGQGGASDFLTGRSPRRPLKTVARALLLMAANGQHAKGGAVRLLRGDVFPHRGLQIKTGGQDAAHPFVVEDYWNPAYGKDPGTRPVLASDAISGISTGTGGGSPPALSNLLIRRVHLRQTNLADSKGSFGVNFNSGGGGRITFDDCLIERFGTGVVVETASGDYFRGLTFSRCVIRDSFSLKSHSQGLYVAGTKDLLVGQCVLDSNGHKSADLKAGDIFSHNAYLQFSNGPAVFWGNLTRNAGSYGLQARSGGVVAYNVFSKDPLACYLDRPGGYYHKNVVEKANDIINPDGRVEPRGLGITISVQRGFPQYPAVSQAGQVAESNVLVNSQGRDNRAVELAQNDRAPIRDVILRDNTVYDAGRGVTLFGSIPDPPGALRLRMLRNAVWSGNRRLYEVQYVPKNWSWYESKGNLLGSDLARPFFGAWRRDAADPKGWSSDLGGTEASSRYVRRPWPVDPVDLASYNADLGGGRDEAEYVGRRRDRPPGVWSDADDMTKVYEYFAAHYRPKP